MTQEDGMKQMTVHIQGLLKIMAEMGIPFVGSKVLSKEGELIASFAVGYGDAGEDIARFVDIANEWHEVDGGLVTVKEGEIVSSEMGVSAPVSKSRKGFGSGDGFGDGFTNGSGKEYVC